VNRLRALVKAADDFPLHPFLLGLYPVLTVVAANLGEIQLSDAVRSIVFSAIVVVVVWGLAQVALRDWRVSAVLTSIALVALFSYGHVYQIVKPLALGGIPLGRHRFLVPLYLGASFVAVVLAWRSRSASGRATPWLNVVALVALAAPVWSVVAFLAEAAPARTEAARATFGETASSAGGPDIYYIIADAYTRSDVLSERFGYDNSDFDAFLKSRGFYIADRSLTNYTSTGLSLSSSLNLDYLSNLGIDLSLGQYPLNMTDYIVHSRVRTILEDRGYTTVAFATGYQPTELTDAEHFIRPEQTRLDALRSFGNLNAFEGMFLSTTLARALIDLDSQLHTPFTRFLAERAADPENLQREIILTTLDQLPRVAAIPGPKFVFAHITAPHTPYFFGPDGEIPAVTGPFTLQGTTPASDWLAEVPMYTGQVAYVNSRLEDILDQILEDSVVSPVILLQGDHGPEIGLDWEHPDTGALKARAAILNAYHLPERCGDALYPEISPVNSFRVVFRCLFGTDLDLLENVSYYNPHVRSQPWDLQAVTDILR